MKGHGLIRANEGGIYTVGLGQGFSVTKGYLGETFKGKKEEGKK